MARIAEAAARHGLLLWEDCAQVFTGLGGYLGHPRSDATFFSFGVIKRATALGGGVARIRDAPVMSGTVYVYTLGLGRARGRCACTVCRRRVERSNH